jgi:hypothetical protein
LALPEQKFMTYKNNIVAIAVWNETKEQLKAHSFVIKKAGEKACVPPNSNIVSGLALPNKFLQNICTVKTGPKQKSNIACLCCHRSAPEINCWIFKIYFFLNNKLLA